MHKNGQCYFVSPDGTQFTRYWMNQFHGIEMTNAMFEFSEYFRELHLTDAEISLILPLQMCYTGSIEFVHLSEIFRLFSNRFISGRSGIATHASCLLSL